MMASILFPGTGTSPSFMMPAFRLIVDRPGRSRSATSRAERASSSCQETGRLVLIVPCSLRWRLKGSSPE